MTCLSGPTSDVEHYILRSAVLLATQVGDMAECITQFPVCLFKS